MVLVSITLTLYKVPFPPLVEEMLLLHNGCSVFDRIAITFPVSRLCAFFVIKVIVSLPLTILSTFISSLHLKKSIGFRKELNANMCV